MPDWALAADPCKYAVEVDVTFKTCRPFNIFFIEITIIAERCSTFLRLELSDGSWREEERGGEVQKLSKK